MTVPTSSPGGMPPDSNAVAAKPPSEYHCATMTADAVVTPAVAPTLRALAGAEFGAWRAALHAAWRAGDAAGAEAIAVAALGAFPSEPQTVLDYAAVLHARGADGDADTLLRGHAGHPLVALQLAGELRGRGCFEEACEMVSRTLQDVCIDAQTYWRGCQFLEECGRQSMALACYEARIAAAVAAPEDWANAARLAMQLGRFPEARERYGQAVARGLDPLVWHVATALATCQRYVDPADPDLGLFGEWLQRPGLTGVQRAGLLFALGKLHDDLGAYREAADCWHEANVEMAAALPWSKDIWTHALAAVAEPWAVTATRAAPDWVPVFVVGMPRSGTTLVARLLARQREVRNRGELMWIPQLSDQILERGERQDPTALARAADDYARMVVQDDVRARWYLDKQNFNFMHLGLIAALFPQAHVIYCVRDPRDTALSIWSQHVGGGAATAFMYAFDRIAQVTDGCQQMMACWQASVDLPIHTVVYEELVAAPERVLAGLRSALGIPEPEDGRGDATVPQPSDVVATASMWQARQPVFTGSVGRWRHYAAYMPELATLFAAGRR